MNSDTNDSGELITRVPSPREQEFMNSFAIPLLDKTQDEKSLNDISDTFWNLCLWEKGRADILDTKASYLLGLSSIAAAIIAIVGAPQAMLHTKFLWAAGISLVLFTITVLISLLALQGIKYGGFVDRDIFDSLFTHEKPVGNIEPYKDKDPRRCFIRETILQRWLIYRWYNQANDSKFRRLIWAQRLAFISVLSLLIYPLLILYPQITCIFLI